jgi:hypothetical protein
MSKKSGVIQVSEDPSKLIISYSASSRIESALQLGICLIALAMCHYLLYKSQASIFSDNWLLIPICLLGDAGLITLILRSGTAKSPVFIHANGIVGAGIATWRFPGPMTALANKTGRSQAPRCWIDLRYGSTTIRLPGDITEGLTIGVATQINKWSQRRIYGATDSSESCKVKPVIDLELYFQTMFMAIIAIICIATIGNSTYLGVNAPFGSWAKVFVLVFSSLTVGAVGIRWRSLIETEVRRGLGIWIAEAAVVTLLILGGGAIAGYCGQAIEVRLAANTPVTFDSPLKLTETTTGGKGCHRYLILEDPSLDRQIRYCDPYSLGYWNGATKVRVAELRSQLGVRITSIERVTSP